MEGPIGDRPLVGPGGPRLPAFGYSALSAVLILEEHLPAPWQQAAHYNLTYPFLIHTALAFVGAMFRVQPAYAFPLSLAGLVVVSITLPTSSSSLASSGISTGVQAASHIYLLSVLALLFLFSALADFFWLWAHLGSSDTRFLVIATTTASLFLKPLTILTLSQLLRNQGVLDPPPTGANAGAGPNLGAYWRGLNDRLGANGGWLGGEGHGPAGSGGGMPGTWSAPQQSYQPQQQPQRSAASAALARAQQQQSQSQSQRPYSTASSNFSSERLFSEGYQAYDSEDEDIGAESGGGGGRGAVAIPQGGRSAPSEADATPISASFAREAGFVSTQPPPTQS